MRLERVVVGAVALGLCVGLGLAWFRPDRALRTATASAAVVMCTEVFIAGLDPARVYAEELFPRPGLRPLRAGLRYAVADDVAAVEVDWNGLFRSRASYQPERGCLLGPDTVAAARPRSAPRSATPPEPVMDPAYRTALEHAFAEQPGGPLRQVRAIVVMRDGKLVAERYAPGITPDTLLLGYSVSKSVLNALVGILVRQGRLRLEAPAPVPAWRQPGDPRSAITLEQLLRMTSGLDLEETGSGFDAVSRMLFLEPDMAGFAARAALARQPGSHWRYSSGNTLLLAGLVRDAIGGGVRGVTDFARRTLFEPLGMSRFVLTFDAAGTPVASTMFLATARDWARFGQLYLDDGRAGGVRILPEGWVRTSTTPTLDAPYGAGFWVNAGGAPGAPARLSAGLPDDAFLASGNLGQRIVVIPSQRLVIVRMGQTMDPPRFDFEGLVLLVQETLAAAR